MTILVRNKNHFTLHSVSIFTVASTQAYAIILMHEHVKTIFSLIPLCDY